MIVSIQDLFRCLIAIVVFVSFILMLVYFLIGLRSKNYGKAKKLAMIYVCSNALRLLLKHFNLY